MAEEGGAGRDAIDAQRALQPGRVAQFVDGDTDAAVGLLGDRPSGELGGGGSSSETNCELLAGQRTLAPSPDRGWCRVVTNPA